MSDLLFLKWPNSFLHNFESFEGNSSSENQRGKTRAEQRERERVNSFAFHL